MPTRSRRAALLLCLPAILAFVAMGHLPAGADGLEDGDAKGSGFGKEVGGLRMRVRSLAAPIGGSRLLHTVDVEIQAECYS
jgi:hypothetical protein